MIHKIPALANICKILQQIPFLASKNLYRVVTYFLMLSDEKIERFCRILLETRAVITRCSVCSMWKERDKACVFCDDPLRDTTMICVVETWQEALSIEKTEGYKGLYHILGGAICPLDGVSAQDLTIDMLLQRVDDSIKEIILATNQTPEGEATAAFIARKLQSNSHVTLSCLARGIPVGSTLELMDKLTVSKALSERRPF